MSEWYQDKSQEAKIMGNVPAVTMGLAPENSYTTRGLSTEKASLTKPVLWPWVRRDQCGPRNPHPNHSPKPNAVNKFLSRTPLFEQLSFRNPCTKRGER
eukprot:44789-Amphidinium_carterae.2